MSLNQYQDKAISQLGSRVKLLERKIQQSEKVNKTTVKNNADFRELIHIQKEQYRQLTVLKKENQKQIETFQDLQESENDSLHGKLTKLQIENKKLRSLAELSLLVSVLSVTIYSLLLYLSK